MPSDYNAANPALGRMGTTCGIFHVGRDDGCHDATSGIPMDTSVFQIHASARFEAGVFRVVRLISSGISRRLDRVQRVGDTRPMGVALRRSSFPPTDLRESNLWRNDAPFGWNLSVDPLSGCVYGPLPLPIGVFPCFVERGAFGCIYDGIYAWALLRRLLLGSDGAFLCFRGDEPPLDGGNHRVPPD